MQLNIKDRFLLALKKSKKDIDINKKKILTVMTSKMKNSNRELFIKQNHINIGIIKNKKDYENFLKHNQKELEIAEAYSKQIQTCSKDITKEGFCIICGKHTKFKGYMTPQWSDTPVFNEITNCVKCHSNNRIRAIFYIIYKNLKNKKNQVIYINEQITYFYQLLKDNFGNYNKIIGSEYLESMKPGEINNNGIRHEDAMSLSFQDNSIDMIISNHVYEHVANIDTSFNESYRVLKKGGIFIFGIPFYTNFDKTYQRAKLDDNKNLVLLDKPIYHGNPVSTKGSLVFYEFGWDIFDKLHNAGFKECHIEFILDSKYGNITNSLTCNFVATK